MRVIGVQHDILWEDKKANYEMVAGMLDASPVEPGALVVLPEMFATGFSMRSETIAEPAAGETELFLGSLARKKQTFVVAGVAARGKDGNYRNKALVFGPDGQLIAFYAKMRLFAPGGEDEHYSPGENPVTFSVGDCRVSPFVCYDLRFPELFRRAAFRDRPELFVVIANWPEKRSQHWRRLLKARAIENQAYVLGVNRVGTDPHFSYGGHSMIVDPNGDVISDAGDKEAVVTAILDLEKLRNYRKGLPFLDDLQPG